MHCLKRWAILFFMLSPSVGYGQGYNPLDQNFLEPRVKRAARERAVARVGPVGRSLVEIYGEDAVAAIFTCSKATGNKLAEFHASGGLDKVPSPVHLLIAIANHGDPVANYAMGHVQELADAWRFHVFLGEPMTYAMALKNLDAGVADYKTRVETQRREREGAARDQRVGLGILGGFILTALLLWRFRRGWFR